MFVYINCVVMVVILALVDIQSLVDGIISLICLDFWIVCAFNSMCALLQTQQ